MPLDLDNSNFQGSFRQITDYTRVENKVLKDSISVLLCTKRPLQLELQVFLFAGDKGFLMSARSPRRALVADGRRGERYFGRLGNRI